MGNSLAIQRLLTIMQRLRHPVTGCEWDSKQTINSIAPHTLEETYEVLDAIERQDFDHLKDELGDLLYHIVFYAEIAAEQGQFDFADICQGASDKLERRHPHIFTDTGKQSGERQSWEQLKQLERVEKQQTSIFDDLPLVFPALMRADKLQKRCASVGFDWHELPPVLDKVYEELDEVLAEVNRETPDPARIEEELGDVLFAVVNLTRHLGCKAETTLQKANQKFERRFRLIEQAIYQAGKTLEETSIHELDAYWHHIKQLEKES